jgi:hypothetical protein
MACAYSASRELVEGHGAAIRVEDWTVNEFGIRRALIDTNDGAVKLATFYQDRALLARSSRASRMFATAYGWETVVSTWHDLLTSISRGRLRIAGSSRRVEAVRSVEQQLGSATSGLSITVKMVAREAGRLEASILADARHAAGDVRLPAVQPSCRIASIKVPRQQGLIGLAPTDAPVFAELEAIFPILTGWLPGYLSNGSAAARAGPDLLSEPPGQGRQWLAQTVLLMNLSGALPASVLIDAALFGVVCLGRGEVDAQRNLWPELIVRDHAAAVAAARDLLTNAARLTRLSELGRARCLRIYAPDEAEVAASLRSPDADPSPLAVGA